MKQDFIQVRVDALQLELLKSEAQEDGSKVSTFVRECALAVAAERLEKRDAAKADA